MNNRVKISTIIGIVVVVATLLIFLVVNPLPVPSVIIGLVFILYSEVFFFGSILLIEHLAKTSSGIITRAGIGTTVALYSAIVFVSSILYMATHIVRYKGFLVFQIILFVLAFAIMLILASFAKTKNRNDAKVLNADAVTRDFVNDLMEIRDRVDNKSAITPLIEGIKYSDTSSIVDADVEIEELIKELKEMVTVDGDSDAEFDSIIQQLGQEIKKRKLQTKNLKSGGI